MADKNIILIDDDPSLRSAIGTFLERLNFQVRVFDSVELAIKEVGSGCDLIISDVVMPGLSGYDLLKFVRKKFPNTPIILMTAYANIEKAVDAMKQGAYDFLVKPFSLSVLETAIQSAFLDRQSVLQKKRTFVQTVESDLVQKPKSVKRVQDVFLTQNQALYTIIENIKKVAASKATILIQGESGTGKELIAHMVHEFSPRCERPFIAINCAAMPDTLLESELFGHEKGSFTGAIQRQIGKFELSNNGTILLDEISEMSLPMQTKLLRVLQECEVYRVGGTKPIPLNLRVIATTNRDLLKYTREGNFREDLFYRLNVIPVKMPPLRERKDDILPMVGAFLSEFSETHARKAPVVDRLVEQKILAYAWPGNVRELRNTMERAVLVDSFDVIGERKGAHEEDTLVLSPGPNEDGSLAEGMTLADVEREMILKTLDRLGGNRTKTAMQLGISLRTLRNKLKLFGHTRPEKSA